MENSQPKPPAKRVKVKLTGTDGNVFAVLGLCKREMQRSKLYTKEQIDQFMKEAMSGDYSTALGACMEWCDVR